ncbi:MULTISPECIES: triacylglycerol lipase [unclassified Corynebacterium]|uniref:esterase/lipase family protein n=1 Tax=unclassified Corynebacterium TaxID=2624378 RepID=UPI001EF728CF|nr:MULTISPECIES: alpha/beta fold hydrolase [unclassified Corynebacterium]MCG7259128.1 alpha/beta fold hydrolase [Corynebacterium sp. ACRQK]MCG7263426.1 alpha/beta fold hydrolase [Corynebacterium sp. ACRQL]
MKVDFLARGRARRSTLAAAAALSVSLSALSSFPPSALAADGDAPSAVSDAAVPAGVEGNHVAKAPVNNPTCVPSPEHPNPVVFIHGTSDNSTRWQKAANALSKQGFCTWAFNYGKPTDGKPNLLGRYAMVDIDDSAKEIASTIDYILSVTGAEKVDLVGHSQGGLHLKKYIAENGGGEKVGRAVGLAATYHGTTLAGMDKMLRPIVERNPKLAESAAGKAGVQQLVGSELIDRLNQLPDTDKRVQYTNLYSAADTTATPNKTSMLESVDGADVANVEVGASCKLPIPPAHAALPKHDPTIGLILWGLTREAGDHTPAAEHCSNPTRGSASSSAASS